MKKIESDKELNINIEKGSGLKVESIKAGDVSLSVKQVSGIEIGSMKTSNIVSR